ncbi:MAG: bifunctional riboflavin kinase/FAD synthetase [Thermoflavifilum sp.]|nr:bifunctional riboflavin kinase/FAD synthetase [Thermoflavifilum sp.]MCL6513422.1 bifunctional riboflavin kinase/FAD synthetase [Alicyclobacillus sp.]
MNITEVHAPLEQAPGPAVLAIGKFDGVHLGHRAILSTAQQYAAGARLAVMTFWPHPVYVLTGNERYRQSLTPPAEQARQLAQLGVDDVYRVHFTKAFAATPGDEFVHTYLFRMPLRRIVVGEDFRFGHGGRFTAQDLKALCEPRGIPVTIVDAILESGAKVSSSRIREHLEHGRVEAAEALLGRPYAVTGVVEHGAALGRQLGFPTANLGGIDDYVLPATGVYAVAVALNGREPETSNWFGVANLGYRPTVNGSALRLEVHLLDFSGDLYGRTLRVAFLRRLREEKRFADVEALRAQIAQDVARVREMVGR